MAADPEAQWEIHRACDADPRPARDREIARVVRRHDDQWSAREIRAVVAQRETQRARDVARTAGQPRRVGRHATAARHRRQAVEWLERTNEDAAGPAGGIGDGVQAVVHAVVQVDVRVSALAVEEVMATRTERGVRGFVLGPEIRLDLHDAAGGSHTAAA